MQVALDVEVPLLILFVISKTLVLLRVHRRMNIFVRVAVAIPAVFLVLTYGVLWMYHVPYDVAWFFSNATLMGVFGWYTVTLWITRKEHYV